MDAQETDSQNNKHTLFSQEQNVFSESQSSNTNQTSVKPQNISSFEKHKNVNTKQTNILFSKTTVKHLKFDILYCNYSLTEEVSNEYRVPIELKEKLSVCPSPVAINQITFSGKCFFLCATLVKNRYVWRTGI